MKTIKFIILFAVLLASCTKQVITAQKPLQPQHSITISVGGISAASVDSVKIDDKVYTTGFPLTTGSEVVLPTSATATASTVTIYVRKVSGQSIIFTDAEGIVRSSVYPDDFNNPPIESSLSMNIGFGTQSASVFVGVKGAIY